jgi:hypothetical protein
MMEENVLGLQQVTGFTIKNRKMAALFTVFFLALPFYLMWTLAKRLMDHKTQNTPPQ